MTAPSREALLRLNAAVDAQVAYQGDPELLEDAEGRPLAFLPAPQVGAFIAGVIVTRGELDAAGLTPGDVPNLTVIDPEENK